MDFSLIKENYKDCARKVFSELKEYGFKGVFLIPEKDCFYISIQAKSQESIVYDITFELKEEMEKMEGKIFTGVTVVNFYAGFLKIIEFLSKEYFIPNKNEKKINFTFDKEF